MEHVASSFRVLGDAARLRLLRALARSELAAGEAARVVGLAASTVSKHLAILREAGLVVERRDGRFSHYSVPSVARHDPRWEPLFAQLDAVPDGDGDLARLDDLLRERRESETGESGRRRAFVPGRSWAAWARALTCLVPQGLRVADLGCGDGALSLEIARFAGQVVGVDQRAALVSTARKLAAKRGVRNARFETGDFESPKLRAGGFDVVVFSQSLHATEDPARALAAAARLLVPGGRLVLLDLLPHGEAWVTERLGHRHLGFAPKTLAAQLRSAGFRGVRMERAAGRSGDPFRVLLATAVRGGEASE